MRDRLLSPQLAESERTTLGGMRLCCSVVLSVTATGH